MAPVEQHHVMSNTTFCLHMLAHLCFGKRKDTLLGRHKGSFCTQRQFSCVPLWTNYEKDQTSSQAATFCLLKCVGSVDLYGSSLAKKF